MFGEGREAEDLLEGEEAGRLLARGALHAGQGGGGAGQSHARDGLHLFPQAHLVQCLLRLLRPTLRLQMRGVPFQDPSRLPRRTGQLRGQRRRAHPRGRRGRPHQRNGSPRRGAPGAAGAHGSRGGDRDPRPDDGGRGDHLPGLDHGQGGDPEDRAAEGDGEPSSGLAPEPAPRRRAAEAGRGPAQRGRRGPRTRLHRDRRDCG
mmetsp:Transcript_106814/g.319343  ORF Transcript_106814/g.319343 Transcript_106814/m.319343 type:complete len:204 (+) Transcript_106814:1021-1632(+)